MDSGLEKVKKGNDRTSLVVPWMKICLPMQKTWVRILVKRRVRMPRSNWAPAPQLLSLSAASTEVRASKSQPATEGTEDRRVNHNAEWHTHPTPLHCNQRKARQLSHSVVSDSLWPHELQRAMPPCPSPTPGVYSYLCPLSRWCHPTISSSVVPFSSHLQSFPASRSFPMNQFFASGGQSIGVSASTSVLPMSIQDWFPFRWTGWISSQSKGLSRSPTSQFKSINSSVLSFLYSPTLTSI